MNLQKANKLTFQSNKNYREKVKDGGKKQLRSPLGKMMAQELC